MRVKTIRTHYEPHYKELGLEATLNKIGYENVLQVLPCYCGENEYFYTIIYRSEEDE